MSAEKKTLEERIACIIRLLASDRDGEILAAVAALKRTLESVGTDVNGLAHGIENLGKSSSPSADEMKKIWDAAVQHTENRLHGTDEFRSTDGKPSWQKMALFCHQHIDRIKLDSWHDRNCEFINDMASRTTRENFAPSQRTYNYLLSMFYQCGGRLR
jgi:hypothetical protein